MQNGTYKLVHQLLMTEYKLVAYNGSLRVFNLMDEYQHAVSSSQLESMYTVYEQLSTKAKSYDIQCIYQGVLLPVIKMNASYGLCVHKISKLKLEKGYRSVLMKPVVCKW